MSPPDETPGLGSLVPKVYDDLAQPFVHEVGQTVGGVVRALLSPINLGIWTAEQATEYARERISQRFQSKRPETVTAPDPAVALPALVAIRYTNDALRALFVNLIATAMDAERASRAHPAFVEIIRQLHPTEALILAALDQRPGRGLIDFVHDSPVLRGSATTPMVRIHKWVLPTAVGCRDHDAIEPHIGNLERLGLIDVSTRAIGPFAGQHIFDPAHLHDTANYPEERALDADLTRYPVEGYAERRAIFLQSASAGLLISAQAPRITTRWATATPFGLQFSDACTRDEDDRSRGW